MKKATIVMNLLVHEVVHDQDVSIDYSLLNMYHNRVKVSKLICDNWDKEFQYIKFYKGLLLF